jgi:hypothetical protein
VTVGKVQIKPPSSKINGPLTVCKEDPRFFADGDSKPIFLCGSHNWSNVQEVFSPDSNAEFDYAAHLKWLQSYGHNYTRGWHWEATNWTGFATAGDLTNVRPLPYARTGPGTALDGRPKFDLTKYNQDYFDRLRRRVIMAGEHGIYFSVMLFEGFSVDKRAAHPTDNPWDGHPYNARNNVNGIDGSGSNPSGGRATRTLSILEVTGLQEAYVREVIETVNDLDNVLYEIGNEHYEDSFDWQCHLAGFIRDVERTMPKQHLVGITSRGGSDDAVTNAQLFSSPADWISPRQRKETVPAPYQEDPPANDGGKVIIADTDHLGGLWGEVPWVWKSLTRGLNVALKDPYQPLCGLENYPHWAGYNHRDHPMWEPVRRNMRYARYFAERMDLAVAMPRADLASSRFCLAQYGQEYLVYVPAGQRVTVDLGGQGTFAVEWFDPDNGTLYRGDTHEARAGEGTPFVAPFAGSAVLYLIRS